jgi:aspartate-semialdehyde dehydrogenase
MTGTSRIVIVGESLIGREVRDVFEEQAPDIDVKAAAIVEGEAVLTERGGEPALLMGIDEEMISTSDAIVLAGPVLASRRVLEMRSRARRGTEPPLVDLSYALEEQPGARLEAPLAEAHTSFRNDRGAIYVIAHPAAIVLARFFRSLRACAPVRRWVVHVFEPASERGRPGVDELQQQTVELLSFRSLPKDVFDEQLTFNMLARYGADAPDSLQAVEARIERHLASLLAKAGLMPMPSLKLIQAPVFHGYSLSVWVEFEHNPGPASLTEALRSDGIEVRSETESPPTNVGVAGQSGMTVGLVEADRNDPRGVWFWIVADNHRTSAENAVALVRMLLVPEEGS